MRQYVSHSLLMNIASYFVFYLLLLGLLSACQINICGSNCPQTSSSGSSGQTPTHGGGSKVIPSPTPPTPPGPTWHTLLAQAAPTCANTAGAVWTPVPQVSLSCSNGLTMREISGGCYAGVTLDTAQNAAYQQNALRVSVHVRFNNASDDTTLAAVQMQIPRSTGLPGGFVFTLNAEGGWVLEQMMDDGTIVPLNIGEMSISPGQTVILKLWVQNKTLFAYIDDQLVAQTSDDLNPSPGAVGLMVGKLGLNMPIKLNVREPSSLLCTAPSSSVTYSNFQLDVLR